MRGGWTYIMTNKPRGVLYTGVTAYIIQRIDQQRNDRGSKFCRRYGLHRCVLVEQHDTIDAAIAREKAIKAWKRDWKIELIETSNPDWRTCGRILRGVVFDWVPRPRLAFAVTPAKAGGSATLGVKSRSGRSQLSLG